MTNPNRILRKNDEYLELIQTTQHKMKHTDEEQRTSVERKE